MRSTLLFSAVLLALVGCRPADESSGTPAQALKSAGPTSIDEVELIGRDALFGNPERIGVQISPDGKYMSWIAPVEGVLNVWVAPANDLSAAIAVTANKGGGIRNYSWSYHPGTLLYLSDTGGDEDFHVFAVDVQSKQARDLSPFPKTRARVVGVSHLHPESVLVAMNDHDPKWHDLYRVDLLSGQRTLLEKNDAEIAGYLADANYTVRFATRSRPDGGSEVLRADSKGGWIKVDDIPFEDVLTTGPEGLTSDGTILYSLDSRGRDTSALYAVDSASGKRTLVFEDARADVGGSLSDPITGRVQAVAVDYLREEWKVLDESIGADLKRLREMGPGDFTVVSRTLDDKTWIVAYSTAEQPTTYYRYDRTQEGGLTKLFSARPALDGKPLVPMWPTEIKARDGLSLVSYLTLPKPADPDGDGKPNKPAPMVLVVHGGPWDRDSYGYSSGVQWLANRGYAVLQVNFRGSTGFGKAFTNAGNGEWAGKMHEDLLDAVQWAVRQGVTTPEQVAIFGGSYGGYASLVGLTFTPDTFKCGVDIVGPSNLNTLLSTIPPYWTSGFEQMVRRVGDPRTESGKKLLAERSPLTRADRITRPLLIGQGANDPRVKQAESDQIVAAMQAKNIPVTYVLFPDEGHNFSRPENSKAFNAVAEGFLAGCLGGRAQPIGNDFTGSSITVPAGVDGVPGLVEALKEHSPAIKK